MQKRFVIALLVAALTAIAAPAASAQTFYWSDSRTTPQPVFQSYDRVGRDRHQWPHHVDDRHADAAGLRHGNGGRCAHQRRRVDDDGLRRSRLPHSHRRRRRRLLHLGRQRLRAHERSGSRRDAGIPDDRHGAVERHRQPRTVWFKHGPGQRPVLRGLLRGQPPAAPYWWGFDTSTPNAAPSTAPAPAPAPTPAPAPAPPLPAPTATPTASGTPPVPSFSRASALRTSTRKRSDFVATRSRSGDEPGSTRHPDRTEGQDADNHGAVQELDANAKVSCTINNGHTRLATVKGHADGKTATCRTTNREVRGRTIASMVLTLGGVTTRVKLALPAGALSAVK